jgi:alkanesulfonate monooxygenase SsuD/methylene tetrahydromethanopterin reductase-like flavin-dependent oxidoreductase (luciferase family)
VKLEETRERWEEALSILPRMWTEQVFSHEGKFYQIPPREIIPKPVQQPHPPMFSACSQDDTFQRAGELGLGCLCNVLGSYETVEKRLQIYKDALAKAQPVGKFVNNQVVVSSIGFCDENKQHALERGAEIAAWNVNIRLKNYERGWQGVDLSSVPEDYKYHVRRFEWDPQMRKGVNPDEVLKTARFCVGTPDDCIATIERYEQMGATEIMPIFQAGPATNAEVMNSLRLFGKYVIPHFRAKGNGEKTAEAALTQPSA